MLFVAGVGEIDRQQVAAGVQVVGVHHLGDGVDVARRAGEREASSTAARLLDAGRVRAAGREQRALVLDPVLLGEALEELERATFDRGRLLSETDNVTLLRVGQLEIVRVDMIAGIAHAWPESSGTKALPGSPTRCMSLSMTNAARAM